MKLSKIATAVAALALTGFNAAAHADSYATASLSISNFQWQFAGGTTALTNGTDITIQAGGANSGSASAGSLGSTHSVNAVAPEGQLSHLGGTIALNGTNQTATSTTPPFGGDNLHTYAYGDYEVAGAVINVPLPTPPGGTVPAGVSANTNAISSQVVNGSGTSTAALGTNVKIFVDGTSSILTHLTMDYTLNLLAQLTTPVGPSDNAQASSTWSVTITDLGTSSTSQTGSIAFKWVPTDLNQTAVVTGSAGSQTGVNPTGSLDSASLYAANNDTVNGNGKVSNGAGGWDFRLTAGHYYSFGINNQLQTNVFRDVANTPEPASLALFGIGLMGLVGARRRGKASA